MGVARAPVAGSGWAPACTASVLKPYSAIVISLAVRFGGQALARMDDTQLRAIATLIAIFFRRTGGDLLYIGRHLRQEISQHLGEFAVQVLALRARIKCLLRRLFFLCQNRSLVMVAEQGLAGEKLLLHDGAA